jgi:hypothetical protein
VTEPVVHPVLSADGPDGAEGLTVDASLREHFDRAVSADPGIDPGELAHTAITEGGRIRRRRKRTAAASAVAGLTVFGVVAGLNLRTEPARPANPPAPAAAAMVPAAAPSCSAKPVDRDATDVLILLGGAVTGPQRTALRSALGADKRVDVLQFENSQQAFQKFQALWADSPGFADVPRASQFPDSFRLRLADASQYTAFRRQYAAMGGVGQIIGRVCPPSAPVGGAL